MAVELSPEEISLLKELLQNALGEIRAEIRRTETKAYRDELHSKQERIHSLLDRL